MDKCFVIQPFDGGKFDKRFDDVLAPTIKTAGLEPYRVDRDASVSIPIEQIENGIQSSRVCLADISTDNPNVWFELGYAIASEKEVVLICSEERVTKFPFDVQHRTIIKYKTDSPSDFDKLGKAIAARIQAILQKEGQLEKIVKKMTTAAAVNGLEQFEIAALVAVAQQVPSEGDVVTGNQIQDDMQRAGFTRIAATLGIRGLTNKDMLRDAEGRDYEGRYFTGFSITPFGMSWLLNNTDKIKLTTDPDEIPF